MLRFPHTPAPAVTFMLSVASLDDLEAMKRAAGPALPGLRAAAREAPTLLRGYQILEITIPAGSPAAGRALGDITWPHEWIPVTVMDSRALRDAGPGITLTPGDRVNLLAREPRNPGSSRPRDEPVSQP